ncbi:hypothetical protein ACFLUX_00290 [Chloroflexota bacterium]
MNLAETGHIELFASDFAWGEVHQPTSELGERRMQRLRRVANHAPKVFRIGESVLGGEDVLGHDGSSDIESTLSHASRPDKEQFLSYAALGLDFFVTKDEHHLKMSVKTKLANQYRFQIGKPEECLAWLEKCGIC